MRKLSIINYKGGTGKTSTVVNMGHALALRGKKVLIIDTDPQGSSGYHLGIQSPEKTLYDMLINNEPLKNCIISARMNLDIICGNERLFPAEIHLAKLPKREFILSERLALLEGYDFVLLDCAPSMSLLNQNGFLYTQEVMVPVSMEYLSLVGVKQLLKNIKLLNKLFTRMITVSKVIPTFFDIRNKKSRDIIDSLKRVFPGLLSSPIRCSVALSEAPGYRKTIFEYAPQSKGAEDYLRLADEVMSHGKKTV